MLDAAPPPSALSPAARAACAPETAFQALTRKAGLAMAGPVPIATPLAPIVAQAVALADTLPMTERQHDCRDGSWSSIWLAYPAPAGAGLRTPHYARIPALDPLVSELGGTVGLVVIARIAPGDLLDWHYDPASVDDPVVRLHLPVRTHPEAVTDLCHERVHWPVGGLYYGDYGFPHRIFNPSGVDRLHLYFDVATAAVRDRLPEPACRPDPRRRQLREQAVGLMLGSRAARPAITAGS